jgi:hypothetical protein
MIVNIVRQALTFKISGVTTLGPGEENEAATGACGFTVVSVVSMVPTGLLQNILEYQTFEHECKKVCGQ